MVSQPSSPSREGSVAPVVSLPGDYDIESVAVGCKIFVQKPLPSGQVEERKAEVLSIRPFQKSRFAPTPSKSDPPPRAGDHLEFYVHYVEFNKRLDEWVPGGRLVLTKEMEHPKPPTVKTKTGGASTPSRATPTVSKSGDSLRKVATKAGASLARQSSSASLNKKKGQNASGEGSDDGSQMDFKLDVDEAPSTPGPPDGPMTPGGTFSKSKEIEKLRTSGSMTQSHSEVSRVKNLNKISMGAYEVEPWYFSPYPTEYAGLPMLYICEMCLSYWPSPKMLSRHRTKCGMMHPPGNEIYRHEDISFYEIDGKKQKTWCRNLCLLSKCFLDHKTLYYDVDPFLYYCMALRDSTGCHLIGYFSKEKESPEGYNVACILTLPQHQKKSYGKLLIEFSYELSKRENKLGSPEKPLSDLGLLSYRAYWTEVIVGLLLEMKEDEVTVEEIANRTAFTAADVMHTCQANSMIRWYKNGHIICLTDGIVEQYTKSKNKQRRRIDPSKLDWKPPQFSREQLRFGW